MGADTFRKGVQNYFKKYAYQNTQLADFVGQLGEASHQDLTAWSQSWLRDAGLDTLYMQIKCEAQKISELKLEVENSEFSKMNRTHAFEIAFLTQQGSQVKVTQSLRVLMNQKNINLKEAIGQDCPLLVYPNYHDNDYIKFQLDETTLANLKTSFSKIEDPFMRLMFASTFWQMARDQKVKLTDYADLVMSAIPTETNFKVLRQFIATITGGRRLDEDTIYFYMPNETAAQRAARTKFVSQVEMVYANAMKAAPAGSDLQNIWLDALIHGTETSAGLAQLERIFNSKEKIAGLDVDQDRRWAILQQMCRFNFPNVTRLVSTEEKHDTSSRAKESSLACIASIPNLENKRTWYAQVKSEKTDYSLGQIDQIARNIFPYQQRDLQKAFADDYFDFISSSFGRDQEYLSTVSRELVPAMCDEKSAGRIRQFALSSTKMPAVLVKTLKIAGQEDERCAKVHAFNSK